MTLIASKNAHRHLAIILIKLHLKKEDIMQMQAQNINSMALILQELTTKMLLNVVKIADASRT